MTYQGWRALVACLLVAAASSLVSIVYANAAARQSEQRWCGIVTTLDDAYRATPPQSEAGRKIAADIARLRGEFRCDR
ncbi:hypothetical protein [Micromonospora sp. NPDC047730]|uniref:hypothetical protein n=1 Tax=Micromonospora sp. NPDC047730 TaxID=3364253 RepID=UPI00371FEC1C